MEQDSQIRREKADDPDRHARPEMLADDAAVDLRASEEGKQYCAEPGEEIHPFGEMKADRVASDCPDDDLDQGD